MIEVEGGGWNSHKSLKQYMCGLTEIYQIFLRCDPFIPLDLIFSVVLLKVNCG